MPKLNSTPIQAADLIEYLDGQSDFTFEISVFNALRAHGFTCKHGGTYDDPATNRPRQFDIRAKRTFAKRFLWLAVECKNIGAHFPLLVTRIPRREEEAFYDMIVSTDPRKRPFEAPEGPCITALLPQTKRVRLNGARSLYAAGAPVGKSCAQVGRASNKERAGGKEAEILATDSDIYEKWAQALSSAHDLTRLACADSIDRAGGAAAASVIFPVVVVPDGRLWVADYDSNGNRTSDPQLAERCSFFVDREYYHPSGSGGDQITLSHLEFVTLTGLGTLIAELCGTDANLERTFPEDAVDGCFRPLPSMPRNLGNFGYIPSVPTLDDEQIKQLRRRGKS